MNVDKTNDVFECALGDACKLKGLALKSRGSPSYCYFCSKPLHQSCCFVAGINKVWCLNDCRTKRRNGVKKKVDSVNTNSTASSQPIEMVTTSQPSSHSTLSPTVELARTQPTVESPRTQGKGKKRSQQRNTTDTLPAKKHSCNTVSCASNEVITQKKTTVTSPKPSSTDGRIVYSKTTYEFEDGQQPTPPKRRYVLPRSSNKKHLITPNVSKFNTMEELFFKNVIFQQRHVEEFSKLEDGNSKEKYLFDMIHSHKLLDQNECIVLKYNEENKLYYIQNSSDIIDYIKQRFKYLKCIYQKELKKTVTNNGPLKQGPTYSSIDDILTKTKINFDALYSKDDIVPETSIAWPHYSMWHTLFQEASIYIYSGSHRVRTNKQVHRCTKLKLLFPSEKTFMLLFHGRTVHCGAESRVVPGSFNYGHDIRCFSYVLNSNDKNSKLCMTDDKRVTRGSGEKMFAQSTTNKITTNNFKICSCLTNNDSELCKTCDDVIESTKGWNFNDQALNVDVMKEYVHKKKLKKLKSNSNAPVCGNLLEFGWAVYEGINIHSSEYLQLRTEAMNIVNSNQMKKKWSGIQYSCQTNNRFGLDLGEEDFLPNKRLGPQVVMFKQLFINIEQDLLRSVSGFEFSTITKTVLLANFGKVEEQVTHRDYADNKPV
jgi:hypothetical protein